jgi:hypothetical protein
MLWANSVRLVRGPLFLFRDDAPSNSSISLDKTMRNLLWATFVALGIALSIHPLSFGQGLQSSPYAAAPFLRRESLNLAPLGPFDSANAQSPFLIKPESILSGDSRKKDIPNLQMGYEFYSGKNWRVGYFTLDYLLPIRMTENSIVFGAAHSELQGSSTNLTRRADEQVFLSMGGGYRTVLRGKTLLGFNCFYDTARFANRWVSSGGAGLEMALLMAGHDALDMKINWYGDLSEGDLVNQYRDGPGNFDLQFGYSHQLFDGGPDLRLFGTVYDFDDESTVWGWQAGGELKSPNGMVSIKGETAYDPVNGGYQSVSAFINIGFQVENLAQGKNPFVMPEPIFSSPRNMNRLTHKVTRNYRNTAHGLQSTPPDYTKIHTRTVTIRNNTGQQQTVYAKFSPSGYNLNDLAKKNGWNVYGSVLSALVNDGQSLQLLFDKPNTGLVNFVMSLGSTTAPTCQLTQAELTLQNNWGTVDNPNFHEGADISLVNGFNYPVTIVGPYSQSQDLKPKAKPTDPDTFYGSTIQVTAATGNSQNYGVFGLGNDQCCASCVMPGGCCSQWTVGTIKNESHPAKTTPVQCPTAPPPNTCDSSDTCFTYPCGGVQCASLIPCQANYWQTYANGTEWTVTFNKP